LAKGRGEGVRGGNAWGFGSSGGGVSLAEPPQAATPTMAAPSKARRTTLAMRK
jgi:hypothetical protein